MSLYGIKRNIQESEEYIKMSITTLHDILEKVLDNDDLRVAVSELIMEEYKKLNALREKKKTITERSSSPCPCGTKECLDSPKKDE